MEKFWSALDIRHGRIHRVDYLVYSLLLAWGESLFANYLEDNPDDIFSFEKLIFAIYLTYLILLVNARRLRDINLSGWLSMPLILISSYKSEIIEFFDNKQAFCLLGDKIWCNLEIGLILVLVGIIGLALLFLAPKKKDNKYGPYIEGNLFTQLSGFLKRK